MRRPIFINKELQRVPLPLIGHCSRTSTGATFASRLGLDFLQIPFGHALAHAVIDASTTAMGS
jgi:hypothetical protein